MYARGYSNGTGDPLLRGFEFWNGKQGTGWQDDRNESLRLWEDSLEAIMSGADGPTVDYDWFLSGGSDDHLSYYIAGTTQPGDVKTVVAANSQNDILAAFYEGRSIVTDGPLFSMGIDVNGNGSIMDFDASGQPLDVMVGQQTIAHNPYEGLLTFDWADQAGTLWGEIEANNIRLIRYDEDGTRDDTTYTPFSNAATGKWTFNTYALWESQGSPAGWQCFRAELNQTGYKAYTNPIWLYYEPDVVAPTASLSVIDLTAPGTNSHTFTVTYADDVAINTATIDSQDVRVRGPNDYNQVATLVGVHEIGNGTPRTVTYRITAPSENWTRANYGVYTISVETDQVTDTNDNRVPSGDIGSFLVDVNHIPTVEDLSVSIGEDGSLSDVVLGHDEDPDDELEFFVEQGPTHGTLAMQSDGSFTYEPDADWNGMDGFTFKASDGRDESDLGTVNLTVAPVNDVPEAHGQSEIVAEDGSVRIALTASDVETQDNFVFVVTSWPQHGTLTPVPDELWDGLAGNEFLYTPEQDYNGTDAFAFEVIDTGDPADGDLGWGFDGPRRSDAATVAITVTPVNDAPVADALLARTDEDENEVITLTGSDLETPAGQLVYSIATQPQHGSVTLNGKQATYTPFADYNGPDSFTFTVTDSGDPAGSHDNPGDRTSAAAAVSITVNPINDVPVADARLAETDEDEATVIILSGSDLETPAGQLVYSIATHPLHGTVLLNGNQAMYTPSANYNGPDSFAFTVTDTGDPAGSHSHPGNLTSDPATVSLEVAPVNDSPVGQDNDYVALLGESIDVVLLGADVETDYAGLVFTITNGPAHGTLTQTGHGQYHHEPDLGFAGTDSFTYTITDTGDPAGTLGDSQTSQEYTISLTSGYRIALDAKGRWRGFDANGDWVTITLKGGGTGTILLAGAGNSDPLRITLQDTTPKSSLTISTKGRGSWTTVGDIIVHGSLGKLIAKTTHLLGDITIDGSLSALVLDGVHSVDGDHLMTIGPSTNPKAATTLKFGSVRDLVINSAMPIKSVTACYWQDTDLVADEILAPWIGTISLKGDFAADVTLVGANGKGLSLGKLHVAGAVVNSVITLAGGAGSILVDSWSNSELTASWVQSFKAKGYMKRDDSGDVSGSIVLTGQKNMRGLSLGTLFAAGELSADVQLAGAVGTITAAEWSGGSLSAISAKSIAIKGRKWWYGGNLGADMALTGMDAKGVSLGKLQVAGRILDSDITLAGGAGTITVGQWDGGSLIATFAKTVTIKGKKPDSWGLGGLAGDFGATLNLTGQNPPRGISLKKLHVAGTISSPTIDADWRIGSIFAGSWPTGQLTAKFLGTVRVKGDLGAHVDVEGAADRAFIGGNMLGEWESLTLGSFQVKGDMSSATLKMKQSALGKEVAIGKLVVAGWIEYTAIDFMSDVKLIRAGGIRESSLFAGAAKHVDVNSDGVFDMLEAKGDFVPSSDYVIRTLTVTGKVKNDEGFSWINSNVAAPRIGKVLMRNADLENADLENAVSFGVTADIIGKITHRALDPNDNFTEANLDEPMVLEFDEFLIRVV